MLVTRNHHGKPSDPAIRHRPFRASQAAADNPGMHGGGFGVAVALGQRQTADQRSVREFWQILAPLLVRPGCEDRLRRQIRCRSERDRGNGSAHFFGQHAQPFVAQPGAAELFGYRGTDPAHVGDLLPQAGGVGLLTVKRAADDGTRATFREETPSLIAKLLEVVGKVEVHDVSPLPPTMPATLHSVKRQACLAPGRAGENKLAAGSQPTHGINRAVLSPIP